MPPKIIGKGRESFTRHQITKEVQAHIEELGLTNHVVSKVISAFLVVYKKNILENPRVEIRDFGIMETKLVRGRIIAHPESKEPVIASPYYRLAFIPSLAFREKLKERAREEASRT